jgi:hypothetical protein
MGDFGFSRFLFLHFAVLFEAAGEFPKRHSPAKALTLSADFVFDTQS